jgi:hypothetical protein
MEKEMTPRMIELRNKQMRNMLFDLTIHCVTNAWAIPNNLMKIEIIKNNDYTDDDITDMVCDIMECEPDYTHDAALNTLLAQVFYLNNCNQHGYMDVNEDLCWEILREFL